ncbi:retrotransposon polyprotein, putative [Talaromyces stipitatus ATCC 10500]|uniref:Retrotransposon polyprotein, putative n=1 Tax=Talaromyces stipitatus (strain ATCC 10500 / CBS 375.48 / QM 6759 / NRRL 1006) TaxID=441959 RepID=B8MA62_TALSN|nr:retrotransposon polyprotein, putative [Talaromyces stipitatus ATCC 10500]EED18391.1 retrotransposon polyprotein, putative [Talaromyces stipitatus ATCC 10500]
MAGNTTTPTSSTVGGNSDVARLQLRIQELEAQLAAKQPKTPKPQIFDGKRSELKNFLTQMDMHVAINAVSLGTKESKVVFVATCLTGEAFQWIEPVLREYYNSEKKDWSDHTKEILGSFKTFKEKFQLAFGNIDEARNAERQLRQLRQTGSARQLAIKFKQIAMILDYSDDVLIAMFENMLKEDVQVELIKMDRPDNIDEFIEQAVKIDDKLYEIKQKRQEIQGWRRHGTALPANQRRHRSGNHGQRRHDPYGPMPMELDATVEAKTYEKKKVRFDKTTVKCYNCNKTGHYAKECRSPRKERQIKATQENGSNEEDQERYAEWDNDYGVNDYQNDRDICSSFSGTESEMNLHLTTMHAADYEEVGNENNRVDDYPEIDDEPKSQYQDAQERPETEIPTNDEWEEIKALGNPCGSDCQVLYKDPKHPGHGSIAFIFCNDDWCSVHLDAKQGSGYFPRPHQEIKPENCKWLRRDNEGPSRISLAKTDNTAMPNTAKQSAGTGDTNEAQKPEGPKRRQRTLVPLRNDEESPEEDSNATRQRKIENNIKQLMHEWTTLRKEEIERIGKVKDLKATAHGRHFKITANILGSDVRIMIDSGATGNYMDPRTQEKLQILGRKKPTPIPLIGLNGEKLSEEGITDETGWLAMSIDGHLEMINFDIAKLGRDDDETKGRVIAEVTEEITLHEEQEMFRELLEKAAKERQLASSTNVALPTEYEQFRDLFDGTYQALPDHNEWDHTIPLKEGKEPVPQKIYPVSGNEEEALKKYIEENLEKGIPSIIRQKERNNRFENDSYLLPLITEIQDKVRNKKWFTKLDITDAYNRLRIKEGEEWKTAFKTKFGHFEYLVMPFGLTNAPATFQRYINNVISPYLHDFTIAYLDDILIFSNSMEEHVKHVKLVLEQLKTAKLQVKLKKCEFHVQETDFLGHRITQEGIQIEKEKVQAIKDWPQPRNLKELQSFIGLINYYRRYIENYAKIMTPMFKLLKKEIPYEWNEEQQKAFEEAKKRLTKAPILAQHDPELPTTLETDASDFAIGATMTQPGTDGRPRPVAYYSRKLIDAELNYEIHDKELLAIVSALRHWRVYLEGATFPIRIIMDYKNLTYFTTTKVLTRRQARWSELLGNYWFTIEHCKGKENERADALSRRPDHEEGIKKPEPALLRLNKEGHLEYNPQVATLAATAETTTDSELQDKIVEETAKDDLIQSLIENEDDKVTATETGLVFWHGLIYIPKSLRNEIIRLNHDTLTSGHPGQLNTMERITRNYYWPRMMKDIETYIKECDACQKNKISRHQPYGLLQEIKAPDYPWQWITMDHIVKLPESRGCDAILVIVDRMTKYAHFIPTTEGTNAEELAEELIDGVFQHHGIPEIIISDRGPTFASKLWKSMMDLMGGEQRLSTAFHPQTNGQTERTNQTLIQYLRHYVNHHQDNWAELLSMAQLAYNSAKHSTTGVSPFFANYGREPRLMGQPKFKESVNATAEEKVQQMKALYFYLHTEIINQNKLTTGYYNEKHQKGPDFKKGEKVYLSRKNIQTTRPSDKLDHLRIGPFEIEEKVSEVNYKLKLPNTMRVHPIFHISLLEPAPQNAKTQEEITIEQETYEVESILAEKESPNGKLYYLRGIADGIQRTGGKLFRTGEPRVKLLDGRSKSTGFQLFSHNFSIGSGYLCFRRRIFGIQDFQHSLIVRTHAHDTLIIRLFKTTKTF